jgi:Uncharacterized protein conserved in bacteria
MGLLDVLTGMQNGPRGQQNPNASSGGMSPITMAVLGLLAYKAVKHFTEQPDANTGTAAPGQTGGQAGSSKQAENTGGGLGGLLGGLLSGQNPNAAGGGLLSGLGGLLAGGAAGGVLSGGLNDLINQLQQTGHGDVAKSWVGTGPNRSISPDDLAKALGDDKINTLSEQTGLPRDELLAGLSQQLPEVVDQLTPHGRVPNEQEIMV